MAEGFCRHLRGQDFEAYSAGIEKHGLNRLAVKVMQEVGIDISGHRSKTLDELGDVAFDLVVTVCGHANETCPVFPGNAKRVYHGFDDPPKLAANARSEEDALRHYRRVRDDIKAYIQSLSLPPGD
jgi:arsenate reductase